MKEQYEVKRLDRPVDWTADVPGSKSMTNRALLMAALSDGEVKLEGVLFFLMTQGIFWRVWYLWGLW